MRHNQMVLGIRGMTSQEQIAALVKGDPEILDAVLDATPLASGVPEQHYVAAKTAREEQLFGAQLAEIDALQAVVDEANAAATIARTDLATVVEMDKASFDKIMLPIENKAAAPWLLKQGDRVVVVVPGATTYQDATETDLREGKYYTNMQAYQQDRAA